MKNKTCTKCKNVFPLDNFFNSKYRKDGKSTICKKCKVEMNRKNNHKRKSEIRKKSNVKTLKTLNGEVFIDIEGYEGYYQISNKGRIKSCLRFQNTINDGFILVQPKIKKQRFSNFGYLTVNLWINQKSKPFSVHRLVASAFIPNPENKPQVNHINGIKTDNRVENLEWCTAQENINHSIKHGLKKVAKGERIKNSKLTHDTVMAIKRLHRINPKFSRKKVAEKLNISRSVVTVIIQGKAWKHVKIYENKLINNNHG